MSETVVVGYADLLSLSKGLDEDIDEWPMFDEMSAGLEELTELPRLLEVAALSLLHPLLSPKRGVRSLDRLLDIGLSRLLDIGLSRLDTGLSRSFWCLR
jgi:uncharacterized protein YjiS (DUF1127 family)